jgi:hypothetical protein
MRKRTSVFIISFVTVLICIISLCREANGQGSVDRKCLIIVSGHGGYSEHELGKAASFRDMFLVNGTLNDLVYLTDPDHPNSDGPANLSNVENAFDWLRSNSGSNSEVTVYIFDHLLMNENDPTFLFDDGNLTSQTIDSWLDLVQCSMMTVILNGNRWKYI